METREGVEFHETEAVITPPEGTYFIHGVNSWNKDSIVSVSFPEISCSIQKDGYTDPLRPFGFILELDKGSIVSAHDTDVASKRGSGYTKEYGDATLSKNYKEYSEDELGTLIESTKEGGA